MYNSATKSDT